MAVMDEDEKAQIQVEHNVHTMENLAIETSAGWRTNPLLHKYVDQNMDGIARTHLILGLLLSAHNCCQTSQVKQAAE